ncbi:hypothetical protein HYFRA_00004654 [Hymenoscyphus fraxineus]|uniref:Uncharacterized protein n=1 Tax=Hymenoscyphus fraxineus TaxID=746836 RepID=A0A9N9KVU4_9HELO|nr:hypothetical protein HYFRA_00004654 [Hymenoscyphus fraxineus]
MALTEEGPYRDDPNDRSEVSIESEDHPFLPPNTYFKLPLKVLTISISLLSVATCGLLIANYIYARLSPIESFGWRFGQSIADLSICLSVNFLVTTPAIFLQLPIVLSMAMDIAMSIVILVFSSKLLRDAWPGNGRGGSCNRGHYVYDPIKHRGDWQKLPPLRGCDRAVFNLRFMMGFAFGVSILIGILILVSLLLRLVAVARTRFWEQLSFWEMNRLPGQIALSTQTPSSKVTWIPSYKLQFSVSLLKQGPEDVEAPNAVDVPAQSKTPVAAGKRTEAANLI